MNNIYSLKAIIKLRSILRKLGIIKLLNSILPNKNYEENFEKCLRSIIKHGDVVWDIGANIGHYTKIFSKLVGENGIVIGIEPSKINFARLSENVKNLKNVKLLNIALGEIEGKVFLDQGEDELGATSRIKPAAQGNVDMTKAVNLIKGGIDKPDIVKIDVEGFELEVLSGFLNQNSESANDIKFFAVEIHFKLLEERGLIENPSKIEELLKSNGYKVTWLDASHILGKKK